MSTCFYSMKLSKSSALRDRLGVSRVLGETVLNFNELWKASKSKNRGWNVGVRIGMGMMSISVNLIDETGDDV